MIQAHSDTGHMIQTGVITVFIKMSLKLLSHTLLCKRIIRPYDKRIYMSSMSLHRTLEYLGSKYVRDGSMCDVLTASLMRHTY